MRGGPLRTDVPRDRDASFAPLLIPKHERRFTGFDAKIIANYARRMTSRKVQGFLADQYGVEISPELISSVTDAVMAEEGAWKSPPARADVPAGLLRRAAGRDPRGRGGALQGDLPGAGRIARRHTRHPGVRIERTKDLANENDGHHLGAQG